MNFQAMAHTVHGKSRKNQTCVQRPQFILCGCHAVPQLCSVQLGQIQHLLDGPNLQQQTFRSTARAAVMQLARCMCSDVCALPSSRQVLWDSEETPP